MLSNPEEEELQNRLIYSLESEATIVLLTIYSKSYQEDIAVNEIQAIVDEFYD